MLYDDVQNYLKLNSYKEEGFTREDALQVTPVGLHKLVNMLFDFLAVYEAKVVRLYVMYGLLKFVVYDARFPEANYAQRIAHSITAQTARICIFTGVRTFRRKHIKGWPCLNTPLYVQYLNEAVERETPNASV